MRDFSALSPDKLFAIATTISPAFQNMTTTFRSPSIEYNPDIDASYTQAPSIQPDTRQSLTPPTTSMASKSPETLFCKYEFCNASFRGEYKRGSLSRHIRQKHSAHESTCPCKVPGCFKTFKRQDARVKHYRKCHPSLGIGLPVRRKPPPPEPPQRP